MEPTIARVEQDLIDLDRSLNTKKTYTQTLQRLYKHCGKPLDELGPEDVRDYLRVLIRSPDHGFATYSAFIAAVGFCYKVTLARHEQGGRDAVDEGRRGRRRVRAALNTPTTNTEIRRCLAVQMSERDRALIMLAYGAGMRISEVRHLQIGDIDSEHGVIQIRNGKGRKQRIVMLSGILLIQLRRAWLEQRPEGAWLFLGLYPHMPLTARQIRRVWADIQMRAGLRKHYRFHGLRGSFATHLLDEGTDLRTIQVLLGHAHMSSTMRYVSVQAKHVSGVQSPLDTLLAGTT